MHALARLRRWAALGSLVGVSVLSGCPTHVDNIPKVTYTQNGILSWAREIYFAVEAGGEIPQKLADIPQREGYHYDLKDAWGRDIGYTCDENGTVTFTSLGQDGRPGGSTEDADIRVVFRPREFKDIVEAMHSITRQFAKPAQAQ